VLADAAIPYRTTIAPIDAYDAEHVAHILARDLAEHGAPYVLRLDRARCHYAPAVRHVCEQHGILVLHGPPRHPQYYGQLERQNREHRAWLDAANVVHDGDLDVELELMRTTLNRDWPRRNLGWATPESMWLRRRTPNLDRTELHTRVDERAARLAPTMPPKAVRLGNHFRRAIEHELVSLGFLDLQPGGAC